MVRFLDSYVEQNKFETWFLSITVNVCKDYFRASSSIPTEEKYSETIPMEEKRFAQVEVRGNIQKALARLPVPQKETAILRSHYDTKIRETAAITGVGFPTAKPRLRQGMEKLKLFLGEKGEHYREPWRDTVENRVISHRGATAHRRPERPSESPDYP